MFMQRIDLPTRETARPRRHGLKLAAGLLFVLVGLVLMAPWTIVLAIWVGLVVVAKAIGRVAVFLHDTLLHAGELVLGR